MALFRIANEKELVDAVNAARETRAPFEIVGSGTKRAFGRATNIENTLDVSALSGIVSYEHDELVLTAKAATPIAEIEAVLVDKNQRLGFDPADWGLLFGAPAGTATIGGVLSADANGSARVKFGAARDQLLGYRGVNGFGESYKAGGRVVKNVTGFDLSKLMCGAMGTLGVMTEVTLRVYPKAPASAGLIIHDVDIDAGFAILRRAWASPLEPTGLAYIPSSAAQAFGLGDIGQGAALIRLEGAAAPLEEKVQALEALFRDRSLEEIASVDAIFARIGAGALFADKGCDVWRLDIPPGEAASCIARADALLWVADWAGGLLWLGLPASSASELRAIATKAGGHATLFRASESDRARIAVFQPEEPARAALTKLVKAAFDPLGLFNPDRMYEGV